MKITQMDVYLLNAGDQAKMRRPVVCRIMTDEGIYGDGEAGVAIGTGAYAAVGLLKDFAKIIMGQDPMNVGPIWTKLLKESYWGQAGGAIIFAAISAIDIALLDIKGKALGVPCYQLLGGKYRDSFRCYASQLQFGWGDEVGPFGSVEEYVHITKKALDEGFDAVKTDFIMFDRDGKSIPKSACEGVLKYDLLNIFEERLAAIRNELGYDFDIIVENHSRTDAVSAAIIGEICDKYKIFALEEPTTPLNPDSHLPARRKIKTPLASGERIFSRWGFYNFIKNDGIQLLQPDICNCGGLTEAKRICDMAEVFDCTVQAHVAGSPISTAAALHLQAAIPNFCIHEHHYRSTAKGTIDLGKYDYQPVSNGKITVPELPGLGQEISDFGIKTAIEHVCVKAN